MPTRRIRDLWIVLSCLGCVRGAFAQHDVLFAMDGDEITLQNGNGRVEVGTLRDDEVGLYRPGGLPTAQPFLTMGAQWAYLGDADGDGRYADASTAGPGGDIDLVFLRAGDRGETPRDVFISTQAPVDFAPGLKDGDVFRFAGPDGALEMFVTESQLLTAIGQTPADDVDIDALCQSAAGDLFFSFDLTEIVSGTSAEDGALIYLPAAAITYDAAGNVASILSSAAMVAATEVELSNIVLNSGMLTSVGGVPAYTELSALELDPAGGTWLASSGLTLPHLLLGWDGFSNDGAIVSTALGGSIARINGVSMASRFATTGEQIGLLPDSTGVGGLRGLALRPAAAAPVVVENYPRNLITSIPAYHRIEVASATPQAMVALLFAVGPTSPGLAVPSLTLGGLGELFTNGNGTFVTLFPLRTDSHGFADLSLIIRDASAAGQDFNVTFQVLDQGSGRLSTPAALHIL